MSWRAVIEGSCEHDGLAFPLEIDDKDDWPTHVGLVNPGGHEVVYPLLRTEPVPFELGRHANILLTAYYGPPPP